MNLGTQKILEPVKEVNFEIEDEEQPQVSELNMNIRELVKNEIEKPKMN